MPTYLNGYVLKMEDSICRGKNVAQLKNASRMQKEGGRTKPRAARQIVAEVGIAWSEPKPAEDVCDVKYQF